MANYGLFFRPVLGRNNCSGFLHLWLDDDRTLICIPTHYDVGYDEWNPIEGRLYSEDAKRQAELTRYSKAMAEDLGRIEAIVSDLKANGTPNYGADDIMRRFKDIINS